MYDRIFSVPVKVRGKHRNEIVLAYTRCDARLKAIARIEKGEGLRVGAWVEHFSGKWERDQLAVYSPTEIVVL